MYRNAFLKFIACSALVGVASCGTSLAEQASEPLSTCSNSSSLKRVNEIPKKKISAYLLDKETGQIVGVLPDKQRELAKKLYDAIMNGKKWPDSIEKTVTALTCGCASPINLGCSTSKAKDGGVTCGGFCVADDNCHFAYREIWIPGMGDSLTIQLN